MEVAAKVKCPLHGARFVRQGFIYVSQWERAKRHVLLKRRSEQYRTAWVASFPAELCPTEEAWIGEERVLRLKTGTVVRFLSSSGKQTAGQSQAFGVGQ